MQRVIVIIFFSFFIFTFAAIGSGDYLASTTNTTTTTISTRTTAGAAAVRNREKRSLIVFSLLEVADLATRGLVEPWLRSVGMEIDALRHGPLHIDVEPSNGTEILHNGQLRTVLFSSNEEGSYFSFGLTNGSLRNVTGYEMRWMMGQAKPWRQMFVQTDEPDHFTFLVSDARFPHTAAEPEPTTPTHYWWQPRRRSARAAATIIVIMARHNMGYRDRVDRNRTVAAVVAATKKMLMLTEMETNATVAAVTKGFLTEMKTRRRNR